MSWTSWVSKQFSGMYLGLMCNCITIAVLFMLSR